MRAAAALTTWPALLAGCTAILGVDQEYTVGSRGGAGGSTTSLSTSSQGGGGLGAGGTSTGTGATGGTGTGTGATGGTGTATGTGTGGTATGTGTGGTGATGAGGSGGSEQVVFAATVADCIDTAAPDPDACAEPTEALWIDQPTTRAFLRFEPDGTTAGASVLSVRLELTVGTYSQAQGDTSGEVWQVSPFERADLYSGAPSTLGNVLAGNPGEANPGAVVSWSLPTSLVSPNTPLCLAVVPVSFNSVGYLNLNGISAPRLVVRYQ